MRLFKLTKKPLRLALLAGAFFVLKSTSVVAQPAINPATVTGRAQSQAIVSQLLQNDRIIRASDVKRGMRGYGLSVFQGTKIQKFNIEVLGVLQKARGGGDIVLIKVLDGPVVERQSGIIAGMSGSPVYINGKMLGAIALGWGFPKEPIGGVTPITEMIGSSLPENLPAQKLANIEPAASQLQAQNPDVYVPREALKINGQRVSRVVVPKNHTRLALNIAQQDERRHSGTALMRRTSTLLQISGFSQDALPQLKKIFEPYGLEPFIGPTAGKVNVPSPKLEPGSAVGVQLVSGDMDQTAVGTITFRWGNRVLGFGHPMFGEGVASLPMASAYVHEIFPSYQRSFKLASPIDVVGAVQQDTQFAIGGTVHAKADTLPMSVKLIQPEQQINKTFHVQIMKDPLLTPQLVGAVATEAVTSTLGLPSDKMVEISLRMNVQGAEPIIRHNLFYTNGVINQAALMDLQQSISLVTSNPFAKGNIENIALEVAVRPGRKLATIKSITANHNKVKAGNPVQITVLLESVANPTQHFTRTFTFHVPSDAPTGTMRFVTASSANYWALKTILGGAPPSFTNLPQLVSAWNKVGALDDLTVMASTPRKFLQLDQQTAQNPPNSWAQLMSSSPATGAHTYAEVESQHSVVDHVIDGAKLLTIAIEGKDKNSDDDSAAADGDTDGMSSTDDTSADDSASDSSTSDSEESAAPRTSMQNISLESTFKENIPLTSSSNWNNVSWQDKIALQADLPLAPATPDATSKTTDDTSKKATDTAAKTESSTTTTATTVTSTATTISKTLGRQVLSWVDAGAADFLKGEVNGAVVGSNGIIKPAPTFKQLAATPLPFIWSVAGDNLGNTYFGSGSENNAKLYRLDPSGEQRLVFSTTGIAITALAVDASNNVYAGVSPGGKIYRISPGGNAELLYNTQQSFVWTLQWDASQRLLIGTGDTHGALFRIDPAGDKSTFAATPLHSFTEGHVRALSVANDGTIYAGTSSAGVLYKVDPTTGNATALYGVIDTAGKAKGEILAVTATANGVYFGTSINGTLYRWTSTDGVVALYPSPQKNVYALTHDKAGHIFMATGDKGVVYQLTPGKDAQTTEAARILEPTQTQSLALFLNAENPSRLLVGTGNNGAVFEIPLSDSGDGTFTSRVYDAKREVRWGAVRAVQQNATIQTRSGNTPNPDDTWNEWANVQMLSDGDMRVASPASRYLQYKVLLNGSAEPSSAFARIAVSYQGANQPPTLTVSAPKGGEYWKGKKSITWTGTDPDKDTLTYNIDLINETRKAKSASEDPIKTSPFSLDTTKWEDGVYVAKVQASDILSNPLDPQIIAALTLPFTIDNTPPAITDARTEKDADGKLLIKADVSDALSPIVGAEWRVSNKSEKSSKEDVKENADVTKNSSEEKKGAEQGTGDITIKVTTDAAIIDSKNDDDKTEEESDEEKDKVTDIITATAITTDDTDGWHALAAQDGLFDYRQENIIGIITLTDKEKANLKDGSLQIELRAHDAAGNVATVTLQIVVE